MCVYILNTSGPLYAIAIIKFHCIRGSEIFAGIIILSLYIQTQCECDIHVSYCVRSERVGVCERQRKCKECGRRSSDTSGGVCVCADACCVASTQSQIKSYMKMFCFVN